MPAGRRVGIVTNAGGPAILAADACEANGLMLSTLSEATRGAAALVLPPAASVANPVDMIASASADQYRRTIEIVAADPAIDSLLTIFIPPLVTRGPDVAAAIRAASTAGKPMLATFMGAQGAPSRARADSGVHVPRIGGRRARARDALRRVAAHAA